MKNTLLYASLAFALGFSAPTFCEEAQGDWGGILGGALRVTVHIDKSPDGQYSAILGSPDQSSATFAADKIAVTPDKLNFSIAKFNSNFEGAWDDKQKAWVGKWIQGAVMPLELKRLDAKGLAPVVLKRPQEEAIEKNPRPYLENMVTFTNAKANVTLSGTYSAPRGTGPFPAVVLIAGSGPHKRDEEVFGHKLFLVLADHLNRKGIAVLRYDKRGVGTSTGDYKSATTLDFTADAEAAVAYLKTRSDVDQKHIGILGHSEGGLIAPLAASRDPSLAFVVMMAGPGLRGDRILGEQIALISRAGGESEEKIAKIRVLGDEFFSAVLSPGSEEESKAKAKVVIDRAAAEHIISAEESTQRLETMTGPWFRQFLAYDPIPALQEVKQPLLALNGELDLQVPAKMDLDAIRAALRHNKNSAVIEMPKLNHLFQTAKTGAPSEYGQIEESIAPVALNTISDWIIVHTKN